MMDSCKPRYAEAVLAKQYFSFSDFMTSTMKSAPQDGALEGANGGEIPDSASCCAGVGRRTRGETCGGAAGSAPAPVTPRGAAAPAAPTAPRNPRRLTFVLSLGALFLGGLLLPGMTHPLC